MEDLICGCVKDIGESLLTQCLWPPVKCHIDYWWCFDNNIQGLKDGVSDLNRVVFDIKQNIEEAQLHTVQYRLNVGTEKLLEATRILLDDNIPKAWNLISRYSKGKSAKKTAEEITELRNELNLIWESMGSTSHRTSMGFASRKRIEEDIIESLRNSSVNMIGICGMGGVGKTTMVERIGKRVREEDLFDEVVMVVVSQQVDMLKIQNKIAELLDLKFDVESTSARANKLRTRLMDTKRKIIIFDDVWDDVWECLKLKDLGIPFESGFERCKILFTSRSTRTYREIKHRKVFELKILKEEEAWSLFKEIAGDWVEDSDLLSVAKDVAAECKGLPIALVTVGMALRDENDKCIWEDSLSQLRGSNPTDFPEVLSDVYNPLKLSYDYLKNKSERSLFLLCCLFPEDYNIPVDHLTWYSMGLQIFDKMSIEEARNRTHRFVKNLKSRFLLMDCDNENHVKMHDVVRDVAIFIGSKEEHVFLKSLTSMDSLREDSPLNCNWMSVSNSNERINLPLGLHFPNLRLLMMLKSTSDISFEGMEDLNVLYFSMFESSPPTLGLLKNLRTLHLYKCVVENISVIGESANLEILICFGCHNIEELPAEIGRLNQLRLLDLCDCYNLKTIAFGVISSLVQLEELKMLRSFSNWEAEEKGKKRRNAALTELQSLPNLTCLQIEISDWNLAAQEICLSHKLVKYCINIYDNFFYFDKSVHEKAMCLTLPRHITVGKWIHILVRNTEVLVLDGDGSNNFNLAEIETLRNLKFKYCSTVKKLVNTIDCKFGTPNQNVSLCNLTSIQISNCSNLQYLFSVSMAMSLLQLEVLVIGSCKTMEQVFWNEIKSITEIEFPKLKTLALENLPNFTYFCQGVESIQFPKLTKMVIRHLPKLNSIQFPLNSESPQDGNSFHFLCNQKVETSELKRLTIENLNDNISNILCHHIPINFFSNLEGLNISNLNGIRNLMSSSIAKNLVSLKSLSIESCQDMVEVIEDDEEVVENQNVSLCNLTTISITKCFNLRYLFSVSMAINLLQLEVLEIDTCDTMEQVFWNEIKSITYASIEFPKLETLELRDLPNLTDFWQGVESIQFPNLSKMEIGNLPKLNSLTPLNSESPHDDSSFHFLCNQKVEIGGLKSVTIDKLKDNISNIWCQHIPINFFSNLEELRISNLNGIRNLMSSSIAKNLVSLKFLSIESCQEMVEVFWNEIKSITYASIEFPKLETLKLSDLPNLTTFWEGVETIKFSKLTKMEIGYLPKLNSFTSLNSEPPHDDSSFHFLCNQKVEIDGLDSLAIDNLKDNISNIWCRQIPSNFFSNLYKLKVSNLNGIKNLMSSSIAKNLVSLYDLSIERCQEMVEVIENEEEVVDLSLFPALEWLEINNLLKLRSFCQWKHAFELPLLECVIIDNCPEMETFTLGSLRTPNIYSLTINEKRIDDTKDLNAVILHFRTKSQDEDEDEDESKSESKDEDESESKDVGCNLE